jgi:hypothetical protein
MRRILLTSLLLTAVILAGCGEEEGGGGQGTVAKLLEQADAEFEAGELEAAEADYRVAAALAVGREETAARAVEGFDKVVAERCYLEAYDLINQLQLIEPPPGPAGTPQSMEQLFTYLNISFANVNYRLKSEPLLEAAVRAINRGLDARPEHPGLNYMLALLYSQTGDPTLALDQLKHLREMAPDHWGYERGLAYLLKSAGEQQAALDAAAKGLEKAVTPEDRMLAYELLVEISLDDPDPKLYQTYIDQAKEEFPDYADPLALEINIEVAKSQREGGQPDFEQALSEAETALEKEFLSEFSRESFIYNTASIYASLQRFDEAVGLLQEHVAEGGDFTITMQQLIQRITMQRDQQSLIDEMLAELEKTAPAAEEDGAADEEQANEENAEQ